MEEAVGKVRKRRGEGEEGDNCRNYFIIISANSDNYMLKLLSKCSSGPSGELVSKLHC